MELINSLYKAGYYLFILNSQEISAITAQFPQSILQDKQNAEGYIRTQVTSNSNLAPHKSSEAARASDSMELDSNSSVSPFKPIVAVISSTSEERSLLSPHCRLEYQFCALKFQLSTSILVFGYIK